MPSKWLDHVIHCDKQEQTVYIPKKDGNSNYELSDLYEDQSAVAYHILSKIHEWIHCEDFSTFQPLRCTINGQGGTGKTVLLNTIVSVLRRMIPVDQLVLVGAPTGTAAFNVNGETIHSLSGQTPDQQSLSQQKQQELTRRLKDVLCLIIDERSMLESKFLGNTERIISKFVYNGKGLLHHSWGGIPVVIIAGDDYQLSGRGEGAHSALPQFSTYTSDKATRRGRQLFLEFASTVFDLPIVRRVQDGRTKDRDLLGRIREGTHVTDEDVKQLKSLHLDTIKQKHGQAVVDEILSQSIHLFYTNEKRIRFNVDRLRKVSSATNPVAVLKPIASGTSKRNSKSVSSHFKGQRPSSSLVCLGAKVCIQGQNFKPLWGLHNGACGTVVEFNFEANKNPNNGDLPTHVVVDFPLYRGPIWDQDHPTHVPIPMIKRICKLGCCTREFCPLDLCFARTIHKFQGLGAGPVENGKIRNLYMHVVVDPDSQVCERTQTGLFYTALSRGTTLGDDDGLNSAVYFTGPHLTTERIQKVTKGLKGDTYIKVQRREAFVQHLMQNKVSLQNIPATNRTKLFQWFHTKALSFATPDSAYDFFYEIKQKYTQQNDCRNTNFQSIKRRLDQDF